LQNEQITGTVLTMTTFQENKKQLEERLKMLNDSAVRQKYVCVYFELSFIFTIRVPMFSISGQNTKGISRKH